VLSIRFTEAPVVKDVAYGGNVCVGVDADGQLAEITLVDLSRLLSREDEEDESTLVLTARESRQVAELTEQPPPRSERFLAARDRYRQRLNADEPAVDAAVDPRPDASGSVGRQH
jgi:hypothetical protein